MIHLHYTVQKMEELWTIMFEKKRRSDFPFFLDISEGATAFVIPHPMQDFASICSSEMGFIVSRKKPCKVSSIFISIANIYFFYLSCAGKCFSYLHITIMDKPKSYIEELITCHFSQLYHQICMNVEASL